MFGIKWDPIGDAKKVGNDIAGGAQEVGEHTQGLVDGISDLIADPHQFAKDATDKATEVYNDTNDELYGAYVSSGLQDQVTSVADDMGALGDSIGLDPAFAKVFGYDQKFVDDVIDGLQEYHNIFTGKEAKDRQRIIHKGEELEGLGDQYQKRMNEFEDRAQNKFMLPEIFVMALTNKATRYSDGAQAQMELAQKEYENLVEQYGNDYTILTHLQNAGWAGELIAGLAMIASGLANDINTVGSIGNTSVGEWVDAFVNIVSIVVQVIVIVVAAIAQQWWIVAILVVSLLYSLDGMYGDGYVLAGTFGLIDMVFNDVLHADSFISEFGHFKKTSEHYAEMQMYFRLTVAIAAIIATIMIPGAAWEQAAKLAGMTSVLTQAAPITSTLSDLYKVYQGYVLVDDSIKAQESLDALKAAIIKSQDEIDTRMRKARNRKMLQSFKEANYLLAGSLDVTAVMTAECAANPLSSNPEVMIPIANMTVECGESNKFGYEEVFNMKFIN